MRTGSHFALTFAVVIIIPAGICSHLAGARPGTRPSTEPNGQKDGKAGTRLPEVKVDLLGPISSLTGAAWPREYDWINKKPDQPSLMMTIHEPHEVSIRLSPRRTLTNLSKLTFITQYDGTVAIVRLTPQLSLASFQQAITNLEEVLVRWHARPTKIGAARIADWKKSGDVQADIALDGSFRGTATIEGDSTELWFDLRPSDGGWFVSITVAAPEGERERLLHSRGKKAASPTTEPNRRKDGKGGTRLPEVKVDLLGPISSLTGAAWPREYDWINKKPDQPALMMTLDKPHDLVIRLPGGRALRHESKLTFLTQENGTVAFVKLVPNMQLLPFPQALSQLRAMLKDWHAELKEPTKPLMKAWEKYGNVSPRGALSQPGGAVIHGEPKADIFFEIRPAEDGWFISVVVQRE